jgi:hypothetical protein
MVSKNKGHNTSWLKPLARKIFAAISPLERSGYDPSFPPGRLAGRADRFAMGIPAVAE